MNYTLLREDLIRDEGLRKFPYEDTVGKLTIGIGHNLTDRGLSDRVIQKIYDEDVEEAQIMLDRFLPWWITRPEPVQRALVNLCFNMGIKTLLTFKITLANIQSGQYDRAAQNLLRSKYAKQVGERAQRVANLIRQGAQTT